MGSVTGSRRRLGFERSHLVVEIVAFPGVERHRTGAHGAARPGGQLLTHECMEVFRVSTGIGNRAFIAFARSKDDLARFEQLTEMHEAPSVIGPVDHHLVVAAEAERHAEDLGLAFEEQHREAIMRGAATTIFLDPGTIAEKLATRLEFATPDAGEAHHLQVTGGRQERAGHAAVELVVRLAPVRKLRRHRDGTGGIGRKRDRNGQLGHRIQTGKHGAMPVTEKLPLAELSDKITPATVSRYRRPAAAGRCCARRC